MARIFVLMSLLFATISHAAQWRVYNPETSTRQTSFQIITYYAKTHVEYPSSWCKSLKVTGSEIASGVTFSGSPEISGGNCRLYYPNENGTGSATINIQHKLVGCSAGSRPQSYAQSTCKPFDEIQCPANQTIDPVTGECNCSDGFVDDGTYQCVDDNPDDPTDPTDPTDPSDPSDPSDGSGSGSGSGTGSCSDDTTCLAEAESFCAARQQDLFSYNYSGGGYYQYTCGLKDNDCPEGETWDRPNQVCQADGDNDGTPDPFDPDPQDPENTGDRDGDGVPDSQDSHPDDPDRWNDTSNSNHNGQNVTPVGQSEQFDDSAIVAALNENTQTSNTTNTKLDQLSDQASIGNDLLDGIGNSIEGLDGSLQGISELLNEGEPSGKGTGDLNNGMDSALDDFEEMTINEFNKDLDSGLFVDRSQLPVIETAFGGLELEKCENFETFLFTLELCSLAPRINPILYWAFACFTMIACFHSVVSTLKKETK